MRTGVNFYETVWLVSEQTNSSVTTLRRPHVVIVGAGFGGLATTQALADAAVDVTLIDRRNHHVFQPLLYQVASAALNPSDIAQPIRHIVRNQRNCRVVLGEVQSIDLGRSRIDTTIGPIAYDYLVVATGATHAYFGNEGWADHAPGLKTIEDALDIRRRILLAFERAEVVEDLSEQRRQMRFVVVGAGPTGVELAGAVAEIATNTLKGDFHRIDTTQAEVILIEAGPRVLPSFPAKLSASALKQLERLGVMVRLNTAVTDVTAEGVVVGDDSISAATVLWAAGVAASPLGMTMSSDTDKAGRVPVTGDLSLGDHANVFVIGDLSSAKDDEGAPVPGVAPAAQQGGRHVATCIEADMAGRSRPPFVYKDKGSMATIGRSSAVANLSPRLQFGGYFAWLVWWAVHIFTLIGFRSRMRVMAGWGWQYWTGHRHARLITDHDE